MIPRDDVASTADEFIAREDEVHSELLKQLRLERERFALLAEYATDVVYELDLDGNIVWISSGVRDMLGWDPDGLVGTPSGSSSTPRINESSWRVGKWPCRTTPRLCRLRGSEQTRGDTGGCRRVVTRLSMMMERRMGLLRGCGTCRKSTRCGRSSTTWPTTIL